MLRRSLGYPVFWTVGSLFCFGAGQGCFPPSGRVRTTDQQVRLRLVDSVAGRPLAGAQLHIKQDFDSAWGATAAMPPPGSKPAEYRQHLHDRWMDDPWFPGLTRDDGEVSVVIRYGVVDPSRGAKPPPSRDWVTGRRYLVKVTKQHAPEEANGAKPGEPPEAEMSLMIQVGESAKGLGITVTVVEIQEPQYVEPR